MGRYEGGIFRDGARGDFTEDKFAEYCKIETEKQLAACSRYGFDGIVVSYLGGYDSSVAAPFVLAADTWRRDNPDKLLFFRGYPAFITSIENQTILSECDYVIILTEGASSSVAISRMVRDQLEEGVPSDRIVLEASVPSIADGGSDVSSGRFASGGRPVGDGSENLPDCTVR